MRMDPSWVGHGSVVHADIQLPEDTHSDHSGPLSTLVQELLVASLLLVVSPGATSSFLFPVVWPGATSSVLAPSGFDSLAGGLSLPLESLLRLSERCSCVFGDVDVLCTPVRHVSSSSSKKGVGGPDHMAAPVFHISSRVGKDAHPWLGGIEI